MQIKPSGGFVVNFVVTGDGTGSYPTVNFDLFKPEKKKLFTLTVVVKIKFRFSIRTTAVDVSTVAILNPFYRNTATVRLP